MAATPTPGPAVAPGQVWPAARALFFREVAARYLPVQILEGELVVGGQFNTALSHCLRKGEAAARDGAQRAFLKEWQVLNEHGMGNCGAVPGHLVPDYPKALRLGWQGIAAEAQAVADDPLISPERRDLARTIVISADAVRLCGERYGVEADRLAAAEADPARRAELLEMARMVRKVPWQPPETFPEALQALWTTHMLVMAAESYPGAGLWPGRVDQYLYPFHKAFWNPSRGKGAILGIGQPGGYDYAWQRHREWREEHFGDQGRVLKRTQGRTPYRRSPHSLVGNGFMMMGDAAFQTKPFSGEGVTSSFTACQAAVELAIAALQLGDVSREALWPYNARYFRGQGSKFAAMFVQLPAAAGLARREVDFLFHHGIIFSGEDFRKMNDGDPSSSRPPLRLGAFAVSPRQFSARRRDERDGARSLPGQDDRPARVDDEG